MKLWNLVLKKLNMEENPSEYKLFQVGVSKVVFEEKNVMSAITCLEPFEEKYASTLKSFYAIPQPIQLIELNERLEIDPDFQHKVWQRFEQIHDYLNKFGCDCLTACLLYTFIERYFGYTDPTIRHLIKIGRLSSKEAKGVMRYLVSELCSILTRHPIESFEAGWEKWERYNL